MRITVLHGSYGCETGCCGHFFEVDGDEYFTTELKWRNLRNFEFGHPGYKQDFKEWAEEMVREAFGEEHVQDLDWENCLVSDD